MKHLLIFSLSVAALAPATASFADTLTPVHVVTRPALHSGDTHALNTQPIPPGHAIPMTNTLNTRALNTQPIPPGNPRPITRDLDTRALNTQPIPPGHVSLEPGSMDTRIKRGHHHHKKPKASWDLEKGQDS